VPTSPNRNLLPRHRMPSAPRQLIFESVGEGRTKAKVAPDQPLGAKVVPPLCLRRPLRTERPRKAAILAGMTLDGFSKGPPPGRTPTGNQRPGAGSAYTPAEHQSESPSMSASAAFAARPRLRSFLKVLTSDLTVSGIPWRTQAQQRELDRASQVGSGRTGPMTDEVFPSTTGPIDYPGGAVHPQPDHLTTARAGTSSDDVFGHVPCAPTRCLAELHACRWPRGQRPWISASAQPGQGSLYIGGVSAALDPEGLRSTAPAVSSSHASRSSPWRPLAQPAGFRPER